MIRSSIYGPNVNLMFNAIPNGIYDISVYVWEDNNAENYNVSVEGQIVVGNYNRGVGGMWTKLGPYRKIINDGTINISNSGGFANISGVEIKAVTPAPSRLRALAFLLHHLMWLLENRHRCRVPFLLPMQATKMFCGLRAIRRLHW
ncbi:MAG: hypothetical protein ABJA70_24010 [Chryseolinea sp.]